MLASVPGSSTSFIAAESATQQPLVFDDAVSDDLFDLLPSSLLTLMAFFRQYEPRLLDYTNWFISAGFVLVRDLYGMTSEERRHLYGAVSNPSMPYSLQIRLERLIVLDMGLALNGKNASTQTDPPDLAVNPGSISEAQFGEGVIQCSILQRPLCKDQGSQWIPPNKSTTPPGEQSCLVKQQSGALSINDEVIDDSAGSSPSSSFFSVREQETIGRGLYHQCPKCDLSFVRKDSLTVHYRTHTGSRPFACFAEHCNSAFRSRTALQRHRLAEESTKSISCEFCSKRFKTSSALNRHRVVHDSNRSYQCDVCQKLFRRKDHLDVHHRTHSSEKNYECSLCQKKFKQQSGLAIHRKTHDPGLECQICRSKFPSRLSLYEHKKIHLFPP